VRIPELDGIRGVAILLVLMVHFTLVPGLRDPLFSAVSFGWAGVDLFFVLSGYLITSILLKSRAEPHYFQTFYTNRVLRIFPLYYTFLFGCLFFVPASFAHQAWYWLYLENFLNAWGKSIPVMNHFWSLAIEEQFYLVWPVVVWKLPARRLTQVCAVLIIAIAAARFVVVHFPLPSREFVYALTPLRCDALLFGALVACLQARGLLARFSFVVKWTALTGFALLCFGIVRSHGTGYVEPGIERFGYFGVDLLFASLIAAVPLWRGSRWFAPARSGFLRFFGKYSYAIYVFHYPISRYLLSFAIGGVSPAVKALLVFLVGTVLSVAAALVSWNLLEKHCLALKARLHAAPVTAVTG